MLISYTISPPSTVPGLGVLKAEPLIEMPGCCVVRRDGETDPFAFRAHLAHQREDGREDVEPDSFGVWFSVDCKVSDSQIAIIDAKGVPISPFRLDGDADCAARYSSNGSLSGFSPDQRQARPIWLHSMPCEQRFPSL